MMCSEILQEISILSGTLGYGYPCQPIIRAVPRGHLGKLKGVNASASIEVCNISGKWPSKLEP